jgi:hypothetical protein
VIVSNCFAKFVAKSSRIATVGSLLINGVLKILAIGAVSS